MRTEIKHFISMQAALLLVSGVAFLLMLFVAYELGRYSGYLDTLKIMSGQMAR